MLAATHKRLIIFSNLEKLSHYFFKYFCSLPSGMPVIFSHLRLSRLHFHFSLSCIGEGNGNPLQCSCLENPRDGGAWWAAICGVAQSRTRLKWLSSSMVRWCFVLLFLVCVFSCLFHFWMVSIAIPFSLLIFSNLLLIPYTIFVISCITVFISRSSTCVSS